MRRGGSPGEDPHPGPATDHHRSGRALLLTGARLADGRVVDVRTSGERIQAVGTTGSLEVGPAPAVRIDLAGHLLLPAPAEPHAHYDTAFSAALPAPPEETETALVRRITEAALTALGYGATAQRTHIRIGDGYGLRRLEAALIAQRALRGLAELQLVAMPRLLTGAAGAPGRAQLREALKLGATAAGGCPELDPDPLGYVQILLDAAREADCPVDLHARAADPAQLARLAGALAPLRPRVTLGPCSALAPGGSTVLASAGVRVVCLPQNGLCSGVAGPATGLRPYLVRELTAARVPLSAGGGALRDPGNPVGRADPLEAAYLLAASGALSPEDAYEAVGNQARAALGLPPVRVDAGFPAELLAVRGDSLAGILSSGHSRLVIHHGRIVSRTSAVREFADTTTQAALPRQPGHRMD